MGRGRASLRYFTGTGNSKRVAELVAREFEAAGLRADIGAIPRGGPPADGAELASFAFPVYSLDLPRIVRRYFEAIPARAGTAAPLRALVLVTGGNPDDCGWSLLEAARLLAARGYDPAYADLVRMPNNWGSMMKVPGPSEAAAILAAGEEAARAAARAFLAGERYSKPLSLPVFGPVGSRLVRLGFKRGVKRLWKFFKATEACRSCGICERCCPTNSIRMVEGRPSWSATCEQCMRCFNACPTRAIEQLDRIGRGSTHERYLEPHFEP